MCFGSPSTAAADEANRQAQVAADEAAAREQQREADIKTGQTNIDTAFSGFNDKFFGDRSKSYVDWATPQEADQYGIARNNLIYALANNRNLDSSEGARELSVLDKDHAQNVNQITSSGNDFGNQARTAVATSRASLQQQNRDSASPDGVAASAAGQVRSLQASPTFSPLGNLFQNATAYLAQLGGLGALSNGTGNAPGSSGSQLFNAPAQGSTRTVS